MHRMIIPGIFGARVTAFFTGKDPGADLRGVARLLKIEAASVYLPIQKHTDKVLYFDGTTEPRVADAVVTDRRDVLIGVQVADCVPVLLFDSARRVIAAVHAGWRGTAAGILKKTILFMSDRFACRPEDIAAAIGPGIGKCCYAVDHDVKEAVAKATGPGDYHLSKGEKFFLDLPSANRHQALSSGIRLAHIWVSDECTCCNPDRFFSYRYAKGSTGRQAGFIGML